MIAILNLKNGKTIERKIKDASPVISFFETNDEGEYLDLYSLPTYIEFVFKKYDPVKRAFIYKEK